MTSNLLTQFHYNQQRGMLAMHESYQAFKDSITKADLNGFDTTRVLTPENKPYQVIGGIAILDFVGFTVNTASPLEEALLGVVSLQNFCQSLQQAADDDEVNQIVVNFDSGGGYVMYLPETAQLIQSLSESIPVYAYTSGLLCSAAYHAACNCSYIFASPSALVGNIGAYREVMTYNGDSETKNGITKTVLPDLGITVTTFQSGLDKTIGSKFVPLTPDQEQQIQSQIQKMGTDFRSLVLANRGTVNQEFMEGMAYTGQEAMDKKTNLIDGTVNSLNDFVQLLYAINN
jgi:ClpP class serine protease